MNVTVELQNDCPGDWAPGNDVMEHWLQQATERVAQRELPCLVSVRIVGEQDSSALNSQYRGKDRATNVLSFPCELPAGVSAALGSKPLGDIVLCAPVIAREARDQGKTLEAHWAHMLTHGFLHLQGYDHQSDATAQDMEQLETAILDGLGFPDPYAVESPVIPARSKLQS